ncbi:hypothetical protein [Rickettsiella endosymbiont of Rhagonycha lignosa]|uniref:hypothetical protein n=1 Tax=Rickettsiella endosymbiont of Rhagonycha lignosa TaxID=3077937 RepID=UPI00313AD8A1
MYFENSKILFSNKEKAPNLFKKRLPYDLIKKSKKSLWQKVTKKRRQQLKLSNSLEINNHLFLNQQLPLAESQLKDNLLAFLPEYHAENVIHKLYERFIQNNKINEHAYFHFYNRISAKVDVLKIIDADQGKNIALNPDMVSKVVSALTYSVGLVSSVIFDVIGAVIRHGIGEISDMRKITKAKNKLNHWITDLNFIKLLSIVLTKIHEPDFDHQEKIDYFLDEQFLIFWTLFKKQAKIDTEIPDLNDFWSTCLVEYVKELKCPLLKDNFERCLNEMFKLLQLPFPKSLPTLTEINQPNLSKGFKTDSQESIFLAQLILQVIISGYITLQEFNHKVKIQQNSSTCASKFWRNENNNFRGDYNRPTPTISQGFSSRLITSY